MNAREIRILLVDDDPDYRKVVNMALVGQSQSAKFTVEAAGNLAEGLEQL